MTIAGGVNVGELITQIEEYGFVVIPSLIPEEFARRAADRLIELSRQRPDNDKLGQNLHGLFNYTEPRDDELFIPLVTDPVYLAVARHLLGEGMVLACAGGGCNWWKPGAVAQRLHVDVPNGWFAHNGFPIPNVCLMVNCLWMLTDFTRDNGGTRVMPFSHRSGRTPRSDIDYPHQVAAEGPAGSIVIFDSRIWHGAGANVTEDNHRIGLSIGYHSRALDPTPPMTNWVPIKRSRYDRLPENVRQMLTWVIDD